jgi:hypothetical protein
MLATCPLTISSWVSVTNPSLDSLLRSFVVVIFMPSKKLRKPKRPEVYLRSLEFSDLVVLFGSLRMG